MERAYRLFIASFKESAASLAGLLMALSKLQPAHAPTRSSTSSPIVANDLFCPLPRHGRPIDQRASGHVKGAATL
jgi:hypothetical protein